MGTTIDKIQTEFKIRWIKGTQSEVMRRYPVLIKSQQKLCWNNNNEIDNIDFTNSGYHDDISAK